ncbi:hypothetical protein HNV12_02405 [Methanococcoides sp. SA1]|nr:hypothetical protein [Methanococcoides sp. SA1]
MNKKFTIYLIAITLFSYISFFKGVTGGFIIFSLLVLGLMNYFYHRFYNLFSKNSKYDISNGLFYSSIAGAILLVPFAIGDFSYEIMRTSTSSSVIDLLLPAGIIIYILSIIICFITDAYYNPKAKDVKKSRIALGSFLFYFILYFINAFLSLVIGIAHMLANWS